MDRPTRLSIALIGCVVLIEVALRTIFWWFCMPVNEAPRQLSHTTVYDSRRGYVQKRSQPIIINNVEGPPFAERLNSEGLRGGEYAVPKPDGIFRIVTIGDSCVFGTNLSREKSWEVALERMLNGSRPAKSPVRAYEVMNAGVRGYTSWQALALLEDLAPKYTPDMIIVMVGWNNLMLSTLPYYKDRMTWFDVENKFEEQDKNRRESLFAKGRKILYARSRLAQVVRDIRNAWWNHRRRETVIKRHHQPSGLRFKDEAFKEYIGDISKMYDIVRRQNIRFVVMTPPTVLAPGILEDPEVDQRLLRTYMWTPLSSAEMLSWHGAYCAGIRDLAAAHADIILIDADKVFAPIEKQERLSLFIDLNHFTGKGNNFLAETIFRELAQNKGIGLD